MASRTYKAKRKNWRELPREKWWIEGAIFEGKENSYIITNVKVTDEWEDSEIGADVIGYLVDPETICQDTGLTDKNGRKIFEGDILSAHLDDKHPEDITYVQITWDGFSWCMKESTEDDVMSEYDCNTFEVCGNIFDNPELIGEQP